jgi:hypothetical protein
MGPHILVVGGSGMLREMVEALVRDGGRLSLLSRRASAAAPAGATGYDGDYYDEAGFVRALDAAVAAEGPIELAVAWFHTLKIAAPRRLAERIGSPGAPGRLVQVLGSATADPGHPERLAAAAEVAQGLENCRLLQVVLGFVAEQGRSRWLSNAEISNGVLTAIRADRPLTFVGQVAPWPARP